MATAAGSGRGEDEEEEEDERDEEEDEEDGEDAPFPRIGWTPGSLGARALRPSRKRGPGQATGRTKPPRWENDYWHEAGVFNDPQK